MTAAAVQVDWTAPWLATYRDTGERVAARLQAAGSVASALNAELVQRPIALAAGPLCFVPQADLPPGTAYEAHVHRSACVPTRDNLHDLFNGLVWLHWPVLKRALNERQAQVLLRDGIGPRRGAERDALTLFDENAVLLDLPPTLADALARRDWAALFLRHRADWDGARVLPFGHALLEKLCTPRKAITAHTWCWPRGAEPQAWLHRPEALGDLLASGRAVLPVLGIPGWWPANTGAEFYADAAVFRPPAPGLNPRATIVGGTALAGGSSQVVRGDPNGRRPANR